MLPSLLIGNLGVVSRYFFFLLSVSSMARDGGAFLPSPPSSFGDRLDGVRSKRKESPPSLTGSGFDTLSLRGWPPSPAGRVFDSLFPQFNGSRPLLFCGFGRLFFIGARAPHKLLLLTWSNPPEVNSASSHCRIFPSTPWPRSPIFFF